MQIITALSPPPIPSIGDADSDEKKKKKKKRAIDNNNRTSLVAFRRY